MEEHEEYTSSVTEEIQRRFIKWEGVLQLLSGPLGRTGSDVTMHDPPSIMGYNQEHIQDLKPDRWHGEEVDQHHGIDLILKEGPPCLERWIPMAYLFTLVSP